MPRLESGAKASVAIPLTSLYPLLTVLLAAVILGERPKILQWIGIALALMAGFFMSLGSSSEKAGGAPEPRITPREVPMTQNRESPEIGGGEPRVIRVGVIGAGNVLWGYNEFAGSHGCTRILCGGSCLRPSPRYLAAFAFPAPPPSTRG